MHSYHPPGAQPHVDTQRRPAWQCHFERVLRELEAQLLGHLVDQRTRRREAAQSVEAELVRAPARLLDLLGDPLGRLLHGDALCNGRAVER